MSSKVNNQRILFVAPDPGAGGSAKAILPVLKDLHQRGYKLLVMMPSEGYFSQMLQSNGIDYEVNPYINLCFWPITHNIIDLIKFLPRLAKFGLILYKCYRQIVTTILNFRPNLIYSNSSLILGGYLAAKKYSIPHIWHVHEYGDKDFGCKNFPSNRIKKKRLASTQSISITKQMQNHYNLSTTGVVIYNGIRNLNYSSKQIVNSANHKKFILFVGYITEMKGVTDLINAFLMYCRQEGKMDLIMCGSIEDNYRTYIMPLISKTPFFNRISFAGQVDNVDSYMNKAKALIVPSKYEAFGLVTSEAMFNKCLIIGRNTGGTKEQLDLGFEQSGHEIGLRFNTVEELTTCIHVVESMDQMEIDSFIMPAYKTALRNFTVESYTSRVREYIDSVIEKGIIRER